MFAKTETELFDSGGGAWSEPGGRAQRPAGGEPLEIPDVIRDRLSDEVIDELLAGARSEGEIVGPGGVLAQLRKRLLERAMSAELSEHPGYEPHREPPGGVGNSRNGSTPKTLATEHGPVDVHTPRDRKGTFEPQIVRKGRRRLQGFDDEILALYWRGLSTREIEAHLAEIYGVKVGRDLIGRVTEAVIDSACTDGMNFGSMGRTRILAPHNGHASLSLGTNPQHTSHVQQNATPTTAARRRLRTVGCEPFDSPQAA